jgi:hypothetical protein
MLRLLALVLMIAGCDYNQPDTSHHLNADIDASTCYAGLGEFEIAAPRPGLHYDKSLDVIIDESELRWSFTVRITDDQGNSFAPTADTEVPYPPDAGSWWSLDTYHFELAANTRYTATISVCPTRTETVEFFTSP